MNKVTKSLSFVLAVSILASSVIYSMNEGRGDVVGGGVIELNDGGVGSIFILSFLKARVR